MNDTRPIQYGPPPLRPGYRWETLAEILARFDAMDREDNRRQLADELDKRTS